MLTEQETKIMQQHQGLTTNVINRNEGPIIIEQSMQIELVTPIVTIEETRQSSKIKRV